MTFSDLVLTPQGLRFMGRLIPCSIGRGGITDDKREGDGATPAGCHQIVGGAYRSDRMQHPWGGARGPFRMQPIGLTDIWSDDVNDPSYNHGFAAPDHPFSHEQMRRADGLYDLVLMTDWNWPDATPGKGSAIFLHVWRAPHYPTAGCVAFAKPDLLWITQRIGPDTRLIVR